MTSHSRTFTTPDESTINFRIDGKGAPLLLLQGQGTSMSWWDRMVPILAAHFTTVRFDYLGTGKSAASPKAQFTTRRFATDATQLLDELEIPSAHVFGTSMGGKVAQWLALDHPLRVDRLVLGCTMAGGSSAVNMSPRTAMRFSLPGQAGIDARLRLMYTDSFLAANAPNPSLARGPANRQGITGHWKASTGHDTSALSSAIQHQTLLLHGEDDEVVPPENAQILERLIPNSHLRTFPKLRHGFFDEDAYGTAKHLLQFLV